MKRITNELLMQNSAAFEAYRYSPPEPVSWARLIGGTLLVLLGWLAVTLAVIVPFVFAAGGQVDDFFDSRRGSLATFATFSGIWIGAWVAMRLVHKERLGKLLGTAGRLGGSDFAKGFIAITLTSVLSEALIYAIHPQLERTSLSWSSWLVLLIPVALFCFVQTSSEELLFRGYLMRNLANRCRSPWIWAVLPSAIFVALHMSTRMSAADLALVLMTIGSLTAALVLTVYVTGNLGAAFGMHFGNNLFAFLLVGHQDEFSAFALYRGASIEALATGAPKVVFVGGLAVLCVGLALLMLLNRHSPLKIGRQT